MSPYQPSNLDKLVRRADLWLEAKIPWLKRAQRLVDLPRYAAPPVQVPALDDFQRFSYSIHAQDLQELHDKCPKGPLSKVFHWISHNDASAFVKQIIITGSGLAFTIASNPLDFIADPITVAYSIFGYSLIFTVLFWFQIFLFCYRNFGIQRLMKSVSREYMGGMSFVNCSQPEMFDEVQVVAQGAKVLGKKKYEVPQFTGLDVHSLVASMTHRRTKVFDIDVARTLLLFSASVYERDDEMVQKASEIVEESEERAIEFLKKSEEKILNFAAQWGVRYAAISDCASIGGSYAGVYYSDPEKLKDGEQPWICVVVKGTGPFNFEEWLIDASASKEDAGDWLTGSCHRGFYTSLFPASPYANSLKPYLSTIQAVLPRFPTILKARFEIYSKINQFLFPTTLEGLKIRTPAPTTPYQRIMDSLEPLAIMLKNKRQTDEPVNLWVTGHSLGAGIASLFYARALRDPPKPEILKLRDAYCYGTPRAGGADFLSGFEKIMHDPDNDDKTLWRISNDMDCVAKVPPGVALNRSNRNHLEASSLLNYGPIGLEVHLRPRNKQSPFYALTDLAEPGTELLLLENHDEKALEAATFYGIQKQWYHPIALITTMGNWLVPFIQHHACPAYFNSLTKITGLSRSASEQVGRDEERRFGKMPERRTVFPVAGGSGPVASGVTVKV